MTRYGWQIEKNIELWMYSGKKGKQDLFGKVNSIYLQGMWGTQVSVEADVSGGLPGWSFVGYLASEVREAQDRVRTAIRNLGVELPPRKVTINLSPADLRKEGTGFDLAIAAAILTAYGIIPAPEETWLFLGSWDWTAGSRGSREPLPLRSGPGSWALRGCSCQRRI